MEDNTYIQTRQQDMRIDIDEVSIIRGILRYWLVIVFVTAATYMLAYVFVDSRYVPQYTTSTTFIVNQRGASYSTYMNNKNAQDTATKFTTILKSNVLQKKVAEELGMKQLNASVSARVIPETNLIVLSVTAGSAYDSFRILQSMLENHGLVSEYLLNDIIMDMIQPASIPMAPVNANNSGRGAAMAAGAMAVVLMVVFGSLGRMRDTIKNAKEVSKKLDARLLGTVLFERKHKTLLSLLKRTHVSMLISNPILSFAYLESYKLLTARVRSRLRHAGQKVLLVTSVMENEGKSTIAANLALCMAKTGERVLLIDCDMRKPAQYKIFGIDRKEVKDFGRILEAKDIADIPYMQLGMTKVEAILNSEYHSKSTEIIENGAFSDILTRAREAFDYIIIDSSPMALVADAEAIAKYADASMLVIKQDFASTKDINDTIDILNMQKAKFIGCVLNGVQKGRNWNGL